MAKLNWNEPKFGEDEINAVAEVLRSGYVTEGPKSAEFVEGLKAYFGVEHVILTTSGAAALFLAIKAGQLARGPEKFEVLVPDITFIASATSVELAGGTPILVDVDPERFCIDIDDARRKISPKTRAIMPVHVIGRGCDMKGLTELVKDHDLLMVEDAANALGSRCDRGLLGTIGDIGCFSLQANKTITCGHGGFVVTNNAAYYELMVRIKDFGRYQKNEELHTIVGYNFKFNDILAAVALEQFKGLAWRMNKLKDQRKRYEINLADCGAVRFPKFDYATGEIPLYVDMLVKNRTELKEYLTRNGIGSRECWQPLHRNPPYENQGTDEAFPVAAEISDTSLWLPNGASIELEDIDVICERIREFYR
jgi:perosamine synthetase